MPRVTSQKFTRLHQESNTTSHLKKKPNAENNQQSSGGGGGASNPIFNTDKLGQHILKNPLVAQTIVDKANLKTTDKVLEVGPGTGNLTVKILEKNCKSLTVVEMDPRMAFELSKRFQNAKDLNFKRKLEIIVGDFLKTELPYFDVCISNTPYQISSPLVFKLLEHRPLFRVAILMFQKEFGLRLSARPGSKLWSRLSVNVQLYSKVTHLMNVGKANFRPPPLVESCVVKIEPLNPPPNIAFNEFDGLTRICFNRRNKTVRASFFASNSTLNMLEANWNTWKSQQQSIVTEQEEEEQNQTFASKLEKILQESGYSDSRSAKMDVDDFLSEEDELADMDGEGAEEGVEREASDEHAIGQLDDGRADQEHQHGIDQQ
ncbi:Dimethyladenosine transferase [Puccinia graminis f. sp. tritici]|uniref:rRNA adenine N(6)-methyltransferase n=1 Tax=Puccinia graminis f. sp. tritici TaxID=56615 RepID=A0A5B0LY15_PUCGR|nr:Dimethyladenosine transferase [Puccinia graminis f. sp. tritici]